MRFGQSRRESHLPGKGLRDWLDAGDWLGAGNGQTSLSDGSIGLGCRWLLDVDWEFTRGLGKILSRRDCFRAQEALNGPPNSIKPACFVTPEGRVELIVKNSIHFSDQTANLAH